MQCFHCKGSVGPDGIFIVHPTSIRLEYDNDAYVNDYVGNSARYSGPRQGCLKIDMQTIEGLFKVFHRSCFLEVAGPIYNVP